MGIFSQFYAERIFPALLERGLKGKIWNDLTRTALREAKGQVLEVGFGAARSLPFYPDTVEAITAVEPSSGMSRRATKRISESPILVKMIAGAGETLPFESETFDTVIFILTLCSVQNPEISLSEAKRVLKVGGKLLIMEHVQSHKVRPQVWQYRLTPLQNIIACGCYLNRNIEILVEKVGFTWVNVETKIIQQLGITKELFPILIGHAQKT
jgi:ubiquinone/menaquinone biosynthesis C-methylase UbiE